MPSVGRPLSQNLPRALQLSYRRRPFATSNPPSPSSTPTPTPTPIPIPTSTPIPSFATRPLCKLHTLSTAPVPYDAGWRLQHALCDQLKRDPDVPDALVLLEHEPVYTLGTASSLAHVLFDAAPARPDARNAPRAPCGARLVRTERGGEVTFHGPGQLVAYPILNLRRHKQDLHWYLRSLESVVIKTLADEYGLTASRKEGLTGVWVENAKVCALGLKVSKWITMHGLALNVCPDLTPFNQIVPCGIQEEQLSVSSVHKLAGDEDASVHQCMERARRALLHSFDQVFGPYEFVTCEEDETMLLQEAQQS